MAESFNRGELQAVAAGLYAHRRNFDRLFFTMAGAMYLAAFIAMDIFMALTMLQLNFGATDEFSTGPLVVIVGSGMFWAPIGAARLAQMRAMRKVRFLDDLEAVGITNDLESMRSAIGKVSANSGLLAAAYDVENAHFYFAGVSDAMKKYPWQRLATHPSPAARAKALSLSLD